jgi:metal-responsive CopG/Arc/MetJ family transcriptional regulator
VFHWSLVPFFGVGAAFSIGLLEQVDEAVAKLKTSRSGLIRHALQRYLEEQRCQELRELLKEGYLYRAQESRQLAEEFCAAEQEVWDRLAPWEES